MRTAEDIIDTYYQPNMHWKSVNRNQLIKAVKETQKEVIKECITIAHEQGILGYPEYIIPQLKKLLDTIK